MTKDGTPDDSGSDSIETDKRLPLSRRGILAATGLAGLGMAGAGSAAAQDNGGSEGPPFAVKEHDHSGEFDEASRLGAEAPVKSITVDSLTSAQHNSVVYASEFDTLNAAVDKAREQTDSDIKVILPYGTTRYTDTIQVEDRTVVIEGHGKNESILKADGAHRLLRHRTNAPGRVDDNPPRTTLALRGFTLDMAGVPGEGRAVSFIDGHTLSLQNVRIENINMAERSTGRALVGATTEADDYQNKPTVRAAENVKFLDCEVRFDTVTNRTGAGPRDKPTVVDVDRAQHFLAAQNHIIGKRISLQERPEKNCFNGFRVQVGQGGEGVVRDNLFEQWDQYATWLTGSANASVMIVNNTVSDAGDADILRASAGGDGARIFVHGNSVFLPENTEVRGYQITGDRGIVIQHNGGIPSNVQITENHVEGVLVPVGMNRGGRNIVITDNTFRNNGTLETGAYPAIVLRDEGGGSGPFLMRNARIAGNIIDNTDGNRRLGTIARIWGSEWEGYIVVENNISDGLFAQNMDEAVATRLGESEVEVVVRDNMLTTVESEDGTVPDYEIRGTIQRETIEIDGNPSQVQDTEPHVSLDDELLRQNGLSETAMETIDFWFRYDEDAFYLTGILNDAGHYQPNTDNGFYNYDCVQFGISQGPPGAADRWDQFNLALTPEGAKARRVTFPTGPGGILEEGIDLEIVRDEETNQTIYELAVEWETIQAEFQDAGIYCFDIVGIDDDGDGREGLWQWDEESAIFSDKSNTKYKAFELT